MSIKLGACSMTNITIDSIEGTFLQVYPINMFMNTTNSNGKNSILSFDFALQFSHIPEEDVALEIGIASKQALRYLGYKEGEKQVICCDLIAVKKGLCKQPYHLFPHDQTTDFIQQSISLKNNQSNGRLTLSISKTSEYYVFISSCDYRFPHTSLHGMIHAIQPSGSLPAEKQIKYKFSIIFLLFYLLLSYYTYSTNQYLCYLLLFSASQYFISFLMLWSENQINSTFVEFTWLSTILHSFTQTLLILFILLIAKQIIILSKKHQSFSLSQLDWKDSSTLLLMFLFSLFPSCHIIYLLLLSYLAYHILTSFYQSIHSLEYNKQEKQLIRLKQLYHSLFISICLWWIINFLLQTITKQFLENEWIFDWIFEEGFSHILHSLLFCILTIFAYIWNKEDSQLIPQSRSSFYFKSFLPLSSFFLKLSSLYHFFSFLFLFITFLLSSYLPTSVQSLIQPSPLIHSLEYDRSYQDRLLTPNSSILFNYQPSLPLELVFTTTMHESSSTLPIDMINTLNMFHLFEQQFPFKAIIFSSSPSVITYCQNHSLVVISQIKENPYHMPYVKTFLQTAKLLYNSSHYGYINGDILLTSNIFSILKQCQDLVNTKTINSQYVAAGRVYDSFELFELKQDQKQNLDAFDSLLRKTVITRKLFLRHKHSADYFIFSKAVSFDEMAGIVVGRIRVDNYLLQYVVPKNGSMINLTKKVIGIHQGACSFRCHTKNNNNREDLNWNRGWRWSPRLGFGSLEYADYTF